MVTVPAATPVTTPFVVFTVATELLLLLHEPPLFPLVLKTSVVPAHTAVPPLIVPAFNTGFTVKVPDVDAVPHPDGEVTR